MITIFTPTHNRKENIKQLYESIKNQDFNDFEWIIVDDGSTDGTEESIKKIICEHAINISYYKQKNQGKHIAYNLAVKKAKGDLFICIDDDDTFTQNVFNTINEKYLSIKDNNKIAGLGFLNRDSKTKEIIGTKFPEDGMVENYFNIYNKHNVKGDKLLIFKTNILRKYPFPKIEGEKFVPEALVFNRISKKYDILCINKEVIEVTYLEDGYSSNYVELVKKNPKGNMLYYKELYELSPTLYNVAAYNMYGIFAKKGFINIIKEHPSKVKALIMYIPAYFKYLKKK